MGGTPGGRGLKRHGGVCRVPAAAAARVPYAPLPQESTGAQLNIVVPMAPAKHRRASEGHALSARPRTRVPPLMTPHTIPRVLCVTPHTRPRLPRPRPPSAGRWPRSRRRWGRTTPAWPPPAGTWRRWWAEVVLGPGAGVVGQGSRAKMGVGGGPRRRPLHVVRTASSWQRLGRGTRTRCGWGSWWSSWRAAGAGVVRKRGGRSRAVKRGRGGRRRRRTSKNGERSGSEVAGQDAGKAGLEEGES